MNGFVVQLPNELQAEVVRRGGSGADAESAWITEAVREKLAACAELEHLEERGARGSREAYLRVLAKAPAIEPTPGDAR